MGIGPTALNIGVPLKILYAYSEFLFFMGS